MSLAAARGCKPWYVYVRCKCAAQDCQQRIGNEERARCQGRPPQVLARRFVGFESDLTVGTVTKWLVGRLTAAAEIHVIFLQRKVGSLCIHQLNCSFDFIGPIFQRLEAHLCHVAPPWCLSSASFSSACYVSA